MRRFRPAASAANANGKWEINEDYASTESLSLSLSALASAPPIETCVCHQARTKLHIMSMRNDEWADYRHSSRVGCQAAHSIGPFRDKEAAQRERARKRAPLYFWPATMVRGCHSIANSLEQ